jgi:AmmeMemoRadiSam system protein B
MNALIGTRMPAVAGLFYPAGRTDLADTIDELLAAGRHTAPHSQPKALIVPHAGYRYSGQVAAQAYATLQPFAHHIHTVVVLGPNHRVALVGMALSPSIAFDTPLGDIPVQQALNEEIANLEGVSFREDVHALEHSIEVQLPFLQRVLPTFSIIPIVVGQVRADRVVAVLEKLSHEPGLLLVVSTDLSHYHDYETAQRIDQRTCTAIDELAAERIGFDDACGSQPLNALLVYARNHGWRATRLACCSSGDTSGDRSRVVGYGAWRLDETA